MIARDWMKLTYSVEANHDFHNRNLEVVEKLIEHLEDRGPQGKVFISQEEIDVCAYYGMHLPRVASLESYRAITKTIVNRITRDQVTLQNRVAMESLDQGEITMPSVHHLLAELMNLESNYRVLHWNAEGLGYYSLHKLTEEHQGTVTAEIDRLAEAIRACGIKTLGGLHEVIRMRTSTDLVTSEAPPSTNDMLARLVSYNEVFAALTQRYLDEPEGEHRFICPLLEELVLSAKHRTMQLKSSLT